MDTIRPYELADRADCLSLFDSNVPDYFAEPEREDFARFLEEVATEITFYVVVERECRVVACGGFEVEDDGENASFCWGMVDHRLHGSGLGQALTDVRLRAVRATPGLKQVRLDTSQHTQAFYARFGFRMESVVPDGYGQGLDLWDMTLRL